MASFSDALASVIVQHHILSSQTSFKPVITQVQLSHCLFEVFVCLLEANHFIIVGFPYGFACQAPLTGFEKVLAPAAIQIGIGAFTAYSDG